MEELGEFIGIRFGRLAPGATEPEWMFLAHTKFDGIGGLAEILRRRGAKVESLPQIKHPADPSWFSLLRALPRFLSRRRRVKWGFPGRGSGQSDSLKPPTAVAWHLFDERVTDQIRSVCGDAEVTVNSFLLKHLTQAIRPFLKDQSSVVPWMIPVNIRGKVDCGRDTAVHTSYVGVRVQSYEMVHDVHRNVYAALRSGEHWANWQMYFLGRFITAGMRRALIATGLGASQWNLGAFSNLGDWDREKEITQEDCQGGWLFCPPVLRIMPIGAGCVTFQNRLSLTIQAHASLTTNPAVCKLWVANWVKEIERDLAGVWEPEAASIEVLA
ncbi:MAG: hypothetical protein ABSA69_02365 [Verrucomicrobiota bacterium]|jgi:hypothetical protein